MEIVELDKLKEDKLKDVYPEIAKHMGDNLEWKDKTFGFRKHYEKGCKEETHGDTLVTLCADIEETALRIQYAMCNNDMRYMLGLLWSFRRKAVAIMLIENKIATGLALERGEEQEGQSSPPFFFIS